MTEEASTVPYGRKSQHQPNVTEVHILCITAGLGCDGDSVSIIAANQPSTEDVVLGAISGFEKVHLHNPVLAYENGEELLTIFHRAARGELENFVLAMEGSIPNENISGDGSRPSDGTANSSHRVAETSSATRARYWKPEPVPFMAAFMRWQVIRRAAFTQATQLRRAAFFAKDALQGLPPS
jgi:hypothetical protein